MSTDKIRSALGRLLENPDDEAALADVERCVAAGPDADELRELELGRMRLEHLQLWRPITKILTLEIGVDDTSDIAIAKTLELGRICHEELLRDNDAARAYSRVLSERSDDAQAKQAMGEIEFGRANLDATVEHALVEALDSDDSAVQQALYLRAAEQLFRFGTRDEESMEKVDDCLRQALALDPHNHRALSLAVVVFEETQRYSKLADVLSARASSAAAREDKIAAAYQLCTLLRRKIDDEQRCVEAHQLLLDLDPTSSYALSFLVDHYSTSEEWDHLVALYEDQLSSGAVKQSDEFGVWVQLAMLNWKTRARPAEAEPYFDKVRRVEPTHAGMLQYFRETCGERGDNARLMAILTDAQRALDDGPPKTALLEEIAGLAEGQENARRAIEQYKAILRSDPDNDEARKKLRALYLETESYNAIVELYRQDLARLEQDDVAGRIAVLRDIARIYGDRMESDTALLTVLTQILQLDDTDIDTVRRLIKVYESLGRWRDLLKMQQHLAQLTDNNVERSNLLRAVARRWLDQFSNVQNAISAYEALLQATGDDIEAREKLRELYRKRRSWAKLYDLYESQLDSMDGEQRIQLMQEMAKLAAERLDRGIEAIRLLKEVLVFDPGAEGVLDQLERQAERQKDHQTVAYVLERRIEAVPDDKTKIQLLQKLGVLCADKLDDVSASKSAWRRVLELSPGHKRALRVLRQSYVDSSDWDGLRELYASQDDFEGLVDFLSTTADRSDEPDEKKELSFRAAAVYEGELAAPERAARSYERVLSIDEQNVRAARSLLPIYEEDEKWSRLPGLYNILLSATDAVEEKIEILHKVADITGGPLANKAGALAYARKAYELRPDEDGLRRLEQWSKQSGEWSAFIDVVRDRLDRVADDDDRARRNLELMLASVYASEVGRLDEAVSMYRGILEADPTDIEAAQALEELLRAADRRDDLRWLFELRVERFGGEEQCVALEEWATVEEEVFGEPGRAAALLERVVGIDAQRASALASLTRLQLAAEDYEGAAETIRAHRGACDGWDRLELEVKLAQLELDHLGNAQAALDACRRGLEISADHAPLVELLERLLDRPETRTPAAEALEQIYEKTGAAEKQAGALRALLEGERTLDRRLELCKRLADVREHALGDPAGAFEVLLNAIIEAPAELPLWDRVAELCGAAGRPTDLAEAYRKHLAVAEPDAEAALPDELRLELCGRAAEMHEHQLGDAEGAVPYLEQMLSIEPRSDEAFGRLESILEDAERWAELGQLYQRRIEVTEEDSARMRLLYKAATLSEDKIGADEQAITYFERIIGLDAHHVDAGAALERLYRKQDRSKDLAALLEGRLEAIDGDDATNTRQQLIELYLRDLDAPDHVMEHLDALLAARQDDLDVRALAEECLAVPSLRQPAAALLDGVYESIDAPRDLVRILEVRLEGVDSDEQRCEILHRIATLRDDRLKDDAGAFEALCMLMPLESDDVGIRERLVHVGKRLGEHRKMADALVQTATHCSTPSVRGEILMEAAGLYRRELDDVARAEALYRQVLEIDADDPQLVLPAATALEEVYQEQSEHEKLAAVLAVHVRLVGAFDERRALYARLANLYEDLLDNDTKAVEAWQARLADDASDDTALRALERLYERTGQWVELVEVLRHREGAAEDGDERRRCMVKCAEVLAGELDDAADAINAWRAVLDDFGPEPEVLDALVKLYRRVQRWDDLAEVYDVWLSLSEELDEQVELQAGLGDVRREHLDDPHGALSAYREVLTLQPSHVGARAALEEMLSHSDPDVKREVAETIGPLYEADGDAEQLLKVLDIEIESTYEPTGKLEILERALATAEDIVGSPDRAFDYAARGVRDAIGEAELGDWIDTAERLAAETGRWNELMALYEEAVGEMLDADVQQRTHLRAGDLARTRLEDNERAVRHYRAALDARADDERAMVALEELYESTEDNDALLQILQLRAEATFDDDTRRDLLFRIAALQRGPIADREAAIRTYEQVVEIALDERAVVALEALYEEAQRYEDLIRLYERQLDHDIGEAGADVRVKIAGVACTHLDDAQRALDELAEALLADPAHQGAIGLLEDLLDRLKDPDQRGQVAEMLEPVYLGSHDWKNLRFVLEARLETTSDPTDRRDLLHRLATLYEEQLEDYSAALDAVASQLREEPTDADIWAEVERLGRVIGDASEPRVAEIFASALMEVGADSPETAQLAARTGELFALAGRHEEALRWYRRSYEFSPDSPELFEAIDGLLLELKRHEERVDHYRTALEQVFDDEARVRYLKVIAELQRDELGQDADAIHTLCELLDVDERNEEALDALAVLYQRNDRREDLADLHERRAELADTPDLAAPHRLALAKLLARQEDTRVRAVDQLEIIVTDLPWHEEAIAALEGMLEDADRKPRVIDLLRPLYQRADNWRGLVELNDERLKLCDLPADKVDILTESAALWEDQGDNAEKAFAVVQEAFVLAPDNEESRSNLERLAELQGAWNELADCYQQCVASADDQFVQQTLLAALATVCDEQLDDPRRALKALAQLSDIDPSDAQTLESMDVLCMLLADWATLATVLERSAEIADSDDERADVLRRLGEMKRDMLDDEDGAIAVYEQAIEIAPESVGSLDKLIELYQDRDAPRLVELLEQRIEFATEEDDGARHRLMVQAAGVYESRLANRDDAIRMLSMALDLEPTDEQVLQMLERLYRKEERYDDLLENLKTQAGVAEESSKRVTLRNKIGDLYLEELDDAVEALGQYRLVLEDAESDSHAVAAARRIAEEHEELRIDVAELLEPVLTGAQRYHDLIEIIELRFTAQMDPEERARTLASKALIQEEQVDDAPAARDTLLRALEFTPQDEALHADLNRLCDLTGQFAEYADALTRHAGEAFDGLVQVDLYTRLGAIAEEQLKQPERAIEAYEKALEQAEQPGELLEALDRLYVSTSNDEKLAAVLERRLEIEAGSGVQAELDYRLGKLQVRAFGDSHTGLSTLRLAAELDPEHAGVRAELEKLTDQEELFEDAAEALDTMYRVAQDWAARARLRNKRISYAPTRGERVRLRLELAQMLEEESFDTTSAQDVVQEALFDDPAETELMAQLERLATTNAGAGDGAQAWKRAADAVGEAVAKAFQLEQDGEGDGGITPQLARDLLMRSAAWYQDNAGDGDAAEKRFQEVLEQDPRCTDALLALEALRREPGRERELVETLRSLAELAQLPDSRLDRRPGELRREAKALAETPLEDAELVEQILRDMLEADDSDQWALAELCEVCKRNDDYKELSSLLRRRIELSTEPDVLRDLRHEAAAVAADKLDDHEAAIDLYEQAFEDDPQDSDAAEALRALYQQLERFEDLLRLTERLIDGSSSLEERAALRLESAKICIEILEAPTEGIEHLHAVLEEVPAHAEAVALLATMLEKEQRDDELAELLRKQTALAHDAGDRQVELDYRVQLAELYETRLNDPTRAIDGYDAVLEVDPGFRPALEALARLYEQQGEKAKAGETLARLVERTIEAPPEGTGDGAPATGELVCRLGLKAQDLFAAVGDPQAACRVLERALGGAVELSGAQVDSLRDGLRTLYRDCGSWTELADLYRTEAEEATDDDEKVVKYRHAAEIHAVERDDHAAAATLLENALQLKPDDRDLMLALCEEYTKSGRGKDAIDVLNRVVESYGGRRSKDLADIHQRIASAYLADGDDESALRELEAARKMDPGAIEILHELGMLSIRMSDEEEDKTARDAHLKRAGQTLRSLLLQRLDGTSQVTKADVFYLLAEVSKRGGDKKNAIRMAERALSNDKSHEKAQALLEALRA